MIEFPPCSKRQKLVVFAQDGSKTAVRRCSEPTAPDFQKDMTPEVCTACPVRQAVIEAAKMERAVPLRLEDMYRVKSKEPHKATTEWLPCTARETVIVQTCCGSGKVIRCTSQDSPKQGQEVTPNICRTCNVRKS